MRNQQTQQMAEADAVLARAVAALIEAKAPLKQALSEDVTRLLIASRTLRAAGEGPDAIAALHERAAAGFLFADWAAVAAGMGRAERSEFRRKGFVIAARSEGDSRLIIEVRRALREGGVRMPSNRVLGELSRAKADAREIVVAVGADMPALVRRLEQT